VAAAVSTGQVVSDSPLVSTSSVGPNRLTCKLTTFDSYEHSAYWEQLQDLSPENASVTPEHHIDASQSSTAPTSTSDGVTNNMVYVPTPSPMMYAMMSMPMDLAAQAQAQMQLQMAYGAVMYPGMEAAAGPVADPKPRSQIMHRVFSMASQRERIRWTVDARKLKSSDREAVSPSFEVSCGGPVSFKMVLKPKVMDSNKGGACFKKSRNKGYVELRCVTDLDNATLNFRPALTFRFQVASEKRSEPFRGPVRHNFAERAIRGLPEGQDEWDFGKVVDRDSNTFCIVLELLKDDS